MGQSRAVGTLVYPVEAGNAGTRTVREPVPPVLPKPRLLDRVREALRVRHYSRRTEEAYVAWIRAAYLPSEVRPGLAATRNGVRETSDTGTRPTVAISSGVPHRPSSCAPGYAGLSTSS
jgi:hypothetical protein